MLSTQRSKYSDREVERAGRIDGQSTPPIPHWDADDLPPYPKEIVETGRSTIQSIREAWKKLDEALHKAWNACYQAFVHAGEAIPHPTASLAHAEAQYEAERKKKAPATDHRFTWYWIVATLFTLGEIPFNAIVFRPAGESEIMTIVFTSVLAVSLVFCAHWIGIMARKRQFLAVVGFALVALMVIGGVAWFRAQHMAAVHQTPPVHHVWHTSDQSEQPVESTPTDETPTLIAYFAFNLLLFIVMAAYSYFVHDELLEEIFKWRKTLEAAKARYRTAHDRYVAAYSNRQNKHAQHLSQAVGTSKSVLRLVEVYKTHNLRSRRDRDGSDRHYPKCFEHVPVLDIPEDLQTLVWDAPIEAQTDFTAITDSKENTHALDLHAFPRSQVRTVHENGTAYRSHMPVAHGMRDQD